MKEYPHMCRMDHVEIGHAQSGNDERCPMCQLRDEKDAEIAGLRADLHVAHALLGDGDRRHGEQVVADAQEAFDSEGSK